MAEKARMQLRMLLASRLVLTSTVSIERYIFFRLGMYFFARFLKPTLELAMPGLELLCLRQRSIRLASPSNAIDLHPYLSWRIN